MADLGNVRDQERRLTALEAIRQRRHLTLEELSERDRLEARRDNRAALARHRVRHQLDAAVRKVDRLRRRAFELRIEEPQHG